MGTPGGDEITGTPGDDVIVGLTGPDIIDGAGGNDLICGGSGRDRLVGGTGNDRLYGGPAADELYGGDGNDYLAGSTGNRTDFKPGAGDDRMRSPESHAFIYFDQAPGPVVVDLAAGTADGWGHDTILLAPGAGAVVSGSPFDDTLLGTAASDQLYGGPFGGSGRDRVDGRAGNDTIEAAGDVSGGPGDDSINTESAPSTQTTIHGGSGNDGVFADEDSVASIDTGPGDDSVTLSTRSGLGASEPALMGGDGEDWLQLIDFHQSPVVADLGTGELDFAGQSGSATDFEDFYAYVDATSIDVTGTDAPNNLEVEPHTTGTATIRGLGGNDTLAGGAGDDHLSGGPGTDAGNGRAGTDECQSIEQATNCESTGP